MPFARRSSLPDPPPPPQRRRASLTIANPSLESLLSSAPHGAFGTARSIPVVASVAARTSIPVFSFSMSRRNNGAVIESTQHHQRRTSSRLARKNPPPAASLEDEEPKRKKRRATKTTDEPCCICMSSQTDDISNINGCKHTFCFECISQWSKTENTCPLCKARFTKILSESGEKVKVKPRDQRSEASAALEGLLQSLAAGRHGNHEGMESLYMRSFGGPDDFPGFMSALVRTMNRRHYVNNHAHILAAAGSVNNDIVGATRETAIEIDDDSDDENDAVEVVESVE